jgi:hypothetical protein
MSQSYEPHVLVIQHLSVLENAPKTVHEVQRIVFKAIDERVRNWVESRNDWEGEYGLLDDETAFKPKSWENDEDGNYNVYYDFSRESDGDDYQYFLSALLDVRPDKFGLRFIVDAKWLTKLNGRRASARWQRYLAEQYVLRKLSTFGFELDGEDLFRPVLVDSHVLADGFPHSLDDALKPIDEALKSLESAHPEIDALIKAAREYDFGQQM